MSIFAIGQSVYDIYLPINQNIDNRKMRVEQSLKCMGGPAACAMALCGKWNAKTSLLARVGKDAFGKEILETLNRYQVDTSSMIVDECIDTSISCILVSSESGHRSILNIPIQEERSVSIRWPKSVDVLLLDGHEINLAMEAIQRYPQAITIFDGDRFKEHTRSLIKEVDYLICSQQFVEEYFQEAIHSNSYKKLAALNSNHVILTLGEKGCIYQGKQYPAYPAQVVDTTGAGDIFHGVFAYGLNEGWPIEKIIPWASLTSSMACERLGGITSIPEFHQVASKYNELCEKTNKNL